MPQIISSTSRRTTATAIVLAVLASIVLAACGSSSKGSTTTSTNASATTPATGATTPGARAGRFTAVRECLQKNGITLPKRTPGQRPGGGFLGGGAGPTLPQGVTKAQYEAALKKCGGFSRGGFAGGRGFLTSPGAKQALAKFAACMRENGVSIPAPNTSGKGAIFEGVDTSSPKFAAAEAKCRADLLGAFHARPGAAAGPGAAAPTG